jgi:hypothetical protein
MSFQHNGFQHNAFQVQVGGADGAVIPYRTMMGVGLGVRLLAASQLVDPVERRTLAKLLVAMLLPGKK